MKLQWSIFNIVEELETGYIIRNTFSGAVVLLEKDTFLEVNQLISTEDLSPSDIEGLMGENNIIVDVNTTDETSLYSDVFHDTRENQTDTFTLHLLPTISCQLSCHYCFENGGNRKGSMKKEIIGQLITWLDIYFSKHKLKRLKIVLFGGEPLLGMGIIKTALPRLAEVSEKHGIPYITEIVTNGELMDKEVASFLYNYNLSRVQITLDGPKEFHDQIRFGNKNRPTFDRIIKNISMILDNNFMELIDIRINYNLDTAETISSLIEYIYSLGWARRVNLSFGIIVPSFEDSTEGSFHIDLANYYLSFCQRAKDLGFEIPVEYNTGPWCVATEKHTIVLQPNGAIQKCISTVGRPEYDISTVDVKPIIYPKDKRFEKFTRIDKCKEEKCTYLPICGGGCPWDSMIEEGEKGFEMRFCQKDLLSKINRGLLRLNHT